MRLSYLLAALACAPLLPSASAQTAVRAPFDEGAHVLAPAVGVPSAAAGRSAVLTVTTTADAGAGSLRQAIADANAAPGPHTIRFQIDGGGAYREIFLQSMLPPIYETVTIDGDTQGCTDRAVGPCIRIDGGAVAFSASTVQAGLNLVGAGSAVRNLVITRFFYGNPGSGVFLTGDGGTVTGCRIGTDRAGLVTDPDGTPATGDELGTGSGVRSIPTVRTTGGMPVPARRLMIGGPTAAERNVVGGSTSHGIVVQGDSSRIEGNYSGVGADGQTRIGNGSTAIYVAGNGSIAVATTGFDNAVVNNVASGSQFIGIRVDIGAERTRIEGNRVGTNAAGTAAVPNGLPIPTGPVNTGYGIAVFQARDTRIAGNVVSGNTGAGVTVGIAQAGTLLATGTVVVGNVVGLGADGQTAVPNGTASNPETGFGVMLVGALGGTSTGNRVGGRTAAEANLIAANTRAGILFYGTESKSNEAVGNVIGLAADGQTPRPNGGQQGVGIAATLGAHDNAVGALTPDDLGAVNRVGPHAAPVAFLADAGTGNNVGLNVLVRPTASPLPAVDLGLDGPTANDAGDADTGANLLQNTPELLGSRVEGGQLVVTVRVDSAPQNAAYPLTIRLYSRQPVAAQGVDIYQPVGQFEYPLSAAQQAYTATVPVQSAPVNLAATATDANGNTSELPVASVVVAGEAGPEALPEGYRLTLTGANPFAEGTALRVDVAAAQDVRAELFDLLGRRVATLLDGTVAASAVIAVDGRLLAPGAYVVRVEGEGWQALQRVTLVR